MKSDSKALDHHLKADQIWIELSQEERARIKEGKFPMRKLNLAKAEGYDPVIIMEQLQACSDFQSKATRFLSLL